MHAASPRLLRVALAALLVGAAGAPCVGCAHDYALENRETPVHVWLTAPELAASGGTLEALVYVGAEKAVEGPVRFPRGVPHVALPTLYLTAGDKVVSAVFASGAISATEEVDVDEETWIQVTVRGRTAQIEALDREPRTR